jgi:sn-glycerol 3-phosphate transport system permease protein
MARSAEQQLTLGPRSIPGAEAVPRASAQTPRLKRERVGKQAEKRAYFENRWLGVALIVPQILLIFTFFYWPAGQAVYWAFTLERPWGGGNTWVGLANFIAVLSDSAYWNSVVRSLIFAGASTGIAMGGALLFALLVDRQLPGYKAFRAVLAWPYAIAAPALGLAFRFILAPEAGFAAYLNHVWPGIWNPTLDGVDAMIEIVVTFSWKYLGYNFIFFLSALQGVPRALVEAAALDGAGFWKRARFVQIPLLMPTVFFLLVINITESFQDSFGIVDIMTSGGPARATDLMVYKIYFDGFKGLDYSGAAAQSIILMLLVIGLTIVQFRYIERRVHYRS